MGILQRPVRAVFEKFKAERKTGSRIQIEYSKRYKDKHGVEIEHLRAERDKKRTKELEDEVVAAKSKPNSRFAEIATIDYDASLESVRPLDPTIDDVALYREVVLESIIDKADFYAACNGLLMKGNYSCPKIDDIDDLKIVGDSATGKAVVTDFLKVSPVRRNLEPEVHVTEKKSAVVFKLQKIRGGWLVE